MTNYSFPRVNLSIYPLIVAGWIALAAPSSLGQAGAPATPAISSPANARYVATMTFDVVSVRETNPDSTKGFIVGGGFTGNSSSLNMTNNSIHNMLAMAFGLSTYQTTGLPDWARSAMYDVHAKSDSEADEKLARLTKEEAGLERQHMMQALLADRFNLKAHWETHQGDVFDLVVAKGGPKLQPPDSMQPADAEKRWMGTGDGGDVNLPPLHEQSHGRREYDYIGHSCPMDALVESLAAEFGRPVIDKTGLTGKYDFLIKFWGTFQSDRPADSNIPVPTLDSAIRDMLGLQVERAKGPVRILVIDHIEKPTEN